MGGAAIIELFKSCHSYFFKMNAATKGLTMAQAYARPRFATFLKYGKTELAPPTPGELIQGVGQAAKLVSSAATMQFRHLTVKEAWLNTLVASKLLAGFSWVNALAKDH